MVNPHPANPVNETQFAPPASTGLSVVSFVLGLASIVLCLGPFAGIPAVICGHKALSKIKSEPKKYQGYGMALAGTITGYCGSVLFLIAVFIVIIATIIGNRAMDQLRDQAHMAECSQNLRKIVTAQLSYHIDKDGSTVGKESWSELLRSKALLPKTFACPQLPLQDCGAPEDVAAWSCYVQIQPVSTTSMTSVQPICACPNHGKTLLVVYGDFHTESLKNVTIEQLKEQIKVQK